LVETIADCGLTRANGLVRLIAKGSKRAKSKSGGAIDPGLLILFVLLGLGVVGLDLVDRRRRKEAR